MSYRFSFAPFWLLTLALASPVLAGIPYPENSTIDPRLTLCPGGDMAFHILVRRNSPDPNAVMVVDLCNATGAQWCASGQPASIYFVQNACQPWVLSDQTGLATFALKAGGATSDSTIFVTVDGVPFCHRFLTSPDQNGDLVVNSADEAIFVTKLGTHDLSADFDGDGVVTEADHAILRAHFGHACEMPTATPRSAWGEIKARYR
jgi:hypothetical protein